MGRHLGTEPRSEDLPDQNSPHADLEAYRRFFEHSLDALFIVGNDGRIIEASRAAADLLRYSKRQMRIMSLRDLYAQAAEHDICWKDLKQKGYIKVRKETVGGIDGETYDFGFTPSGFGPSTFTLQTTGTDGEAETLDYGPLVVGGTYSVSETSKPSGWDLTSSVCTIDGTTVTGPTNITVQDGKTTVCTFTNTENQELTRGKIKIIKVTDPASDTTTSFDFTRDYEPSSFSLTGGGSTLSGFLVPGTYSVHKPRMTGSQTTTSTTKQ